MKINNKLKINKKKFDKTNAHSCKRKYFCPSTMTRGDVLSFVKDSYRKPGNMAITDKKLKVLLLPFFQHHAECAIQ